ncbi:alpha/beta-hydrolase [Gloeophyllum trabeum ATCC 11539]|uniref:Alpha/beta-hydrolase n=1 Tax=Gloeophyllum trabeum (strain ATCC 11539 / FP-39264 / Madison 617) TaxID=670483 RepID=S7Q312_GLOTA|nr:alpha/beta-hydrolase [Gloeophyllum trabeum ATCC 11539]EPQ53937.1 alpha/beta-hydrolase [Gloeophyllum trabeum ATCC 11539]
MSGIVEDEARFVLEAMKIPSATMGWNLDAWQYTPPRRRSPYPVIVMAHGLSANKLMSLRAYAESFTERGYACVLFDYRRWGASDGTPRHCLFVSEQLEDYRTVIKYCRQKPEFDPNRLLVWGTSFSGGHCITLASEAHLNIRAAIAQCPFTGKSLPMPFSTTVIKTVGLAIWDVVNQAFDGRPVYIPAVAIPGNVGVMTAPGSVEGMLAIVPTPSDYPNEMSASSIFELPFYNPTASAASLSCPLLLIGLECDNLCPFSGVEDIAKLTKHAEVVRISGDHFEAYPGQVHHKTSLQAQLEFLQRHVPG